MLPQRLLTLLLLAALVGCDGAPSTDKHAAPAKADPGPGTERAAPTKADARPGPAAVVHESRLAVALAPDEPAEHEVFVRLSLPPGPKPKTVLMMSGSFMWDLGYWSVPDPSEGSDRYDWTAHALRAGYATLALDRIGIGRSSRPPTARVNAESNAYVNHQVARALREGEIAGPDGPVGFEKVVAVSHSFSTLVTALLLTRYPDEFDAAVLSGLTHAPRFDNFEARVLYNLHEAANDPKFAGMDYEPGYRAALPGARFSIFFWPALTDPKLLLWDELNTKSTVTTAEWDSLGAALTTKLDVRVPVLLAIGGGDPLFCKEPPPAGPHGTDCSTVERFLAQEGPHLGAQLPSLDGYVLPGAGHNLNVMPNAREWFAFAIAWLERKVPPR